MKIQYSTLKFSTLFLFFSVFNFSPTAWTWGGRGHDTLCHATGFLVENQELKDFLTGKTYLMGYLCNQPDIVWKNLKGESSRTANSSHYMDFDALGVASEKVPQAFTAFETEFTGKKNVLEPNKTFKNVSVEIGTLWWRVEQFHNRNLELASVVKKTGKDNKGLEKNKINDKNKEFVSAVNNLVESMGLMGHFVGDGSQPFHSSVNFDGWLNGHGGIHYHFENTAVSNMGPDLTSLVVEAAKKMKDEAKKFAKMSEKDRSSDKNMPTFSKVRFLVEKKPQERMRALSELSLQDLEKIYQADKLKKPSQVKEEKGMNLRTPAEREPIAATLKDFEPIIISHLARGAALLSLFWEEAHQAAGSPDLDIMNNYWFPYQSEFVPLDYLGKDVKASPSAN